MEDSEVPEDQICNLHDLRLDLLRNRFKMGGRRTMIYSGPRQLMTETAKVTPKKLSFDKIFTPGQLTPY